ARGGGRRRQRTTYFPLARFRPQRRSKQSTSFPDGLPRRHKAVYPRRHHLRASRHFPGRRGDRVGAEPRESPPRVRRGAPFHHDRAPGRNPGAQAFQGQYLLLFKLPAWDPFHIAAENINATHGAMIATARAAARVERFREFLPLGVGLPYTRISEATANKANATVASPIRRYISGRIDPSIYRLLINCSAALANRLPCKPIPSRLSSRRKWPGSFCGNGRTDPGK